MNKAELITAVAETAKVSKKDAEAVVNATFKHIENALCEGDKVSVFGFGTFETRERAARTGRNPQNGKEIEIAASTVPAFSASKALKDAVKVKMGF